VIAFIALTGLPGPLVVAQRLPPQRVTEVALDIGSPSFQGTDLGAIPGTVAWPTFQRVQPTRSIQVLGAGSANTRDYRWEGLLVGALTLGVAGGFLGSRLCTLSDSADRHCVRMTVGLGLLGAFGGGIIGGVVGGAIPKAPRDSS
jgi:hypothetical protein